MELLDIYDLNRKRTGRTIPRGGEVREGERLLVVHVCVMSPDHRLLIQKRQLTKDRYPGCWDLSAGGFVRSGEDSLDAVRRELREEMGLHVGPDAVAFLFTEPFSYVLDDFYLAEADVPIGALRLQEEEVSEAMWASQPEVEAMIRDGRFVDYSPEVIRRVFALASAMSGNASAGCQPL